MSSNTPEGLSFISKLKPSSFRYKLGSIAEDGEAIHWGFIAQDLKELLDPNENYALVKHDGENFLVDHGELIAPLVKAVQQLTHRVIELEERLEISNDQ